MIFLINIQYNPNIKNCCYYT